MPYKLYNLYIGFKNWLRNSIFLLITYLIFVGGFFVFPFEDSQMHRHFYYLFVLFPFLVSLKFYDFQWIKESNIFKISVIFLSYFLITLIWCDNFGLEKIYDGLRYIIQILIFMLLTATLARKHKYFDYSLCTVFSLSIVLGSIYSFIAFYNNNPFPQTRLNAQISILSYATIAAPAYAIAGAMVAVWGFKSSKYRLQAMAWATLIMSLVFVLFTQSRGVLGGLFAAAVLIGIWRRHYILTFITITCSALLLTAVELRWLAFDSFINRISGSSFIERFIGPRYYIWPEVMEKIIQSPFFGYGWGSPNTVRINDELFKNSHNILLALMMDGGLIALVLFAFLIYNLLRFASQGLKKTPYAAMGGISLIIWLIPELCNYHYLLAKPSLSWIGLWLPAGMLAYTEISIKKTYNNV